MSTAAGRSKHSASLGRIVKADSKQTNKVAVLNETVSASRPSPFLKSFFYDRSSVNGASSELQQNLLGSFPVSPNTSTLLSTTKHRNEEDQMFSSQRGMQNDSANVSMYSTTQAKNSMFATSGGSNPRKSSYTFTFRNSEGLSNLSKTVAQTRVQLIASLDKHLTCDKTTIAMLLQMFGSFHDELETKYVLLPAAEQANFQQFLEIESTFFEHVRRLRSVLKQFSVNFEQKDEEISKLVNDISILRQTNGKCFDQINKTKEITFDFKAIAKKDKELEIENIGLNLEKTKQANVVSELVKKLSKIEGTATSEVFTQEIEKLQASMQEQCNRFQELNEQRDKQLSIAQISALSLKAANQKLEKESHQFKQAFGIHVQQIKDLTEENSVLNVNVDNYRERLFMLQEDFDAKTQRMTEVREQLKRSQVFLKKMQEKMDRIELDKSVYVNPPEKGDFDDEVKFFESVRAIYRNNPVLAKRIKADYVELSVDDAEKKVQMLDNRPKAFQNQIFQNVSSSDASFNINHYRYYKFSYFALAQDKYDSIVKENRDIYKTRKVTNLFIGTLRAILDSKWNEAITIEDHAQFSDMGNFTWSWLETFTVDKLTRRIAVNQELIGADESSRQELQAMFYIDLMNPILNKIWEVITFREFLSADTSSDELYFYLHCRNQLFKGAQLEFMESTFQPIHYVKYGHAMLVIKSVMCRYDSSNIEFMIGVIFKRCLKKNNNYIVDAGLVLRLLLEYYRSERIHRFRLIKQLFFSQHGSDVGGQHTLNFAAFRKIFHDNFKGIHYWYLRDCMTLGNGLVTSEIFFVVGTERNFFMKHLRLKMLSDIPVYDKATEQLEPALDFRTKMLAGFLQECRLKLGAYIPQLVEHAVNSGLEHNLSKVNELVGYIQSVQNFKLDSTEMRGKNLPLYLSNLVTKLISAADVSMYYIGESGHTHAEIDFMEVVFKRLESQVYSVVELIEARKKKIERNKMVKLRQLQVWMKKKISRWYNILNIMLLAKLAETMRKEQQNPG